MGKAKRKSGIELLRIIIMFQIVILHLFDYGKLTEFANKNAGMFDNVFDGIWVLCRMPVDVFMLITGYFLVTSEFNLKKVFDKGKKVYLIMLFYSLVLSGIFFAVTPGLISVPEVFKAFMPFFSKRWYFLSIYLVILFLSPFVNLILQRLDKKQYLIFGGIIFVIMSLWPVATRIGECSKVLDVSKIVDPYMGKSVAGLLLLYIIGGYLRRFTTENSKPRLRYLALFFAFCAADYLLHHYFKEYGNDVFGAFNNPFVIGEAISIFLFFRDINFYSPFINTVAATTVGIYAIHENPLVRKWIWQNNFSDGTFLNLSGPKAYLAAFAYCAAIFVVCSLLDLLRQKLFDGIAYLRQKGRKSN